MSRFIICSLFLLLSACNQWLPVPLHLQFQTDTYLNTDREEHSLPVVVRVYQLKRLDAFNEATFQDLWQRDRKVLANSLVSRDEISLTPGNTITYKITRDSQAQYIAVFALFRRINGSVWRAAAALPSSPYSLLNKIKITLRGDEVKLRV